MFEDYQMRAINHTLYNLGSGISTDINKEREKDLGKKNVAKVNFMRFLSTVGRHKCSVVCLYQKPDEDAVVKINWAAVKTDPGEKEYEINLALPLPQGYYHGLYPMFTSDVIKELIELGAFRNMTTLCAFLSKNTNYYTWIFNSKENAPKDSSYLQEHYIYTIIQMASNFGYSFTFKNEKTYELFCSKIAQEDNLFIKNVTYSISGPKKNKHSVSLKGGPSDKLLKVLSQEFTIDGNGNITTLNQGEVSKFSTFYDDGGYSKNNAVMISSNYYSGVIARLMDLDIPLSAEDGNNNIRTIKLFVGRTTYATLDAMDNAHMLNHPFLQTKIGQNAIADTVMKKRDEEYKLAKDTLFSFIPGNDWEKNHARNLYNRIKKYLASSINSNTIAVSANLTSQDDFLIGAVRHQASIDANECYCSANGQSEFQDPYVSFYQQSVYVDMPTLSIPPDNGIPSRLDYTKEIERETIAELNTSHFLSTWNYYGLSVLGIEKESQGLEGNHSKQRLHFNILSENRISDTFLEVCAFRSDATESFENSRLIGVKLFELKNIFSMAIHFIATHAEITALVIINIYMFFSRLWVWPKFSALDMDSILSAIMLVFYGLEIFKIAYNKIIRKIKTKAVMVYKRHPRFKQDDGSEIKLQKKLERQCLAIKRKFNSKLRPKKYRSIPHLIFYEMFMLKLISK